MIKAKGDSDGAWINLGEPAKVVQVRSSGDCAMTCNSQYSWCRAAMLVPGPGEEGTTLVSGPGEEATTLVQGPGEEVTTVDPGLGTELSIFAPGPRQEVTTLAPEPGGERTTVIPVPESPGPHMCQLYGDRFCHCPPDAVSIHPDLPSRYKVVENDYGVSLPMEVAREDCRRQNMHVVAMETYEENQHIVEYLRNGKWTK
jgi:hypothetical protein